MDWKRITAAALDFMQEHGQALVTFFADRQITPHDSAYALMLIALLLAQEEKIDSDEFFANCRMFELLVKEVSHNDTPQDGPV